MHLKILKMIKSINFINTRITYFKQKKHKIFF